MLLCQGCTCDKSAQQYRALTSFTDLKECIAEVLVRESRKFEPSRFGLSHLVISESSHVMNHSSSRLSPNLVLPARHGTLVAEKSLKALRLLCCASE